MAPVDGPELKAALLTSSGDCADPLIDCQAYKDVKKQQPRFVSQDEPVAEPKVQIPDELFCMICKDLLQDAVMIPCCANSFCDESYKDVKKQQPRFVSQDEPVAEPKVQIPDELFCMICKDLLQDAVMIPCCANSFCDESYKDVKKQQPRFVSQDEPVAEPKVQIPDELFCMICKDLLQDAVMIPCCANSFCDECVRQVLLESDKNECPECHETDVSPNTLMTNRFLRTAVLNFKKETGSRVNKIALVKYSPTNIENLESPQPSPDSTVENQSSHADISPSEIEKLTVKEEIVTVKSEIPPTSKVQAESVPAIIDGETPEPIIRLTFHPLKLNLRRRLGEDTEDIQPGTPLADEPPADLEHQTLTIQAMSQEKNQPEIYDYRSSNKYNRNYQDDYQEETGSSEAKPIRTIETISTIRKAKLFTPDVKRSTSNPRSTMVPEDDPEHRGTLLTSYGDYANSLIDRQACKDVKKQNPSFVPQDEPVAEPVQVPNELFCMICKDLLQDVVLIPCCGNSFCDECVRQVLLESDNHECPECHKTDVSPNTLVPNRSLRKAVLNFKNRTGYTRMKKFALVKSFPTHIINVEFPQPSQDSTIENQHTHADSSPPEIKKLTVKEEIVNDKSEIPPPSEKKAESVPAITDGVTIEPVIQLTSLPFKRSFRSGHHSSYDRLSQSRYADNEYHCNDERQEGDYDIEQYTHFCLEEQPRRHPERYFVHSHPMHKSPTAPVYPFATILPVPPFIHPAPQVFAPQPPPPGTSPIDTSHIAAQPPPPGVGPFLPPAASSYPLAPLSKQLCETEGSYKDAKNADDRSIDDKIEAFQKELEKRDRGYSRNRSRSRSRSSGQERSRTSRLSRSYSSANSWTRYHSRCSSRPISSRSRSPLSCRSRSRSYYPSRSRSGSNHKSYTRSRSRRRTESRSRNQAEPRLKRRKESKDRVRSPRSRSRSRSYSPRYFRHPAHTSIYDRKERPPRYEKEQKYQNDFQRQHPEVITHRITGYIGDRSRDYKPRYRQARKPRKENARELPQIPEQEIQRIVHTKVSVEDSSSKKKYEEIPRNTNASKIKSSLDRRGRNCGTIRIVKERGVGYSDERLKEERKYRFAENKHIHNPREFNSHDRNSPDRRRPAMEATAQSYVKNYNRDNVQLERSSRIVNRRKSRSRSYDSLESPNAYVKCVRSEHVEEPHQQRSTREHSHNEASDNKARRIYSPIKPLKKHGNDIDRIRKVKKNVINDLEFEPDYEAFSDVEEQESSLKIKSASPEVSRKLESSGRGLQMAEKSSITRSASSSANCESNSFDSDDLKGSETEHKQKNKKSKHNEH